MIVTESELAAMANALAPYPVRPIKKGDIRYWARQGLLPRATRKRHDGATRNVYPDSLAPHVLQIRLYQVHGLSLAEIKDKLQESCHD